MRKLMFGVLVWALPAFGQNQPMDLRTAAGCGPMQEQFSAKVDKTQHNVAEPEAGKALVYVIVQERPSPGNAMYIGNITTRVGVDGKWVGANYGESYISFSVQPGEHRVCSDWQSVMKSRQKLSGAADLVAEAGKTYFFRVELWTGVPPSGDREFHEEEVKLKAADASEGMLLVSKTGQSAWKKK